MSSDPSNPDGAGGDGKSSGNANRDEHGNYLVGKNRPPENTRFKVGDGRTRGRRAKGVRNVASEFHDELNARMTIKENGVAKKVTKRRALAKTLIDRGLKGSDRAAEIAFRHDATMELRGQAVTQSDEAIIEAFMAQLVLEKLGSVTDDNDLDQRIGVIDEQIDDGGPDENGGEDEALPE